MRILVACEESQEVCKAFRARGHPEWHIHGDALAFINGHCLFQTQDNKWHYVPLTWDIIIAHPPCTDLACSGSRCFKRKQEDGSQAHSIEFFMRFVHAECNKIAIENPIGIMSTQYRKPDQIIQPWQFALNPIENVQKSTCLWLKGLPKLTPAHNVKPEIAYRTFPDGKRQSEWYYRTRCLPRAERGKAASKTFPGIAHAMAEQWG